MTEAQIHVLPGQYIKSFNGSNLGAVPAFPSVPLVSALTLASEADLRAVGYTVAGELQLPRLSKECLNFFDEASVPVLMSYCFVDVDLPGHRPWQDGELERTLVKLLLMPEFASAGFYQTEHGYRLVWKLDEPVPASLWRSWSMQFFSHLAQYEVEVDPGCREWTRIYRLPHATKEDASSPLALHNATGPLCEGATLKWTPSGPLVEEHHATYLDVNFPPGPPDLLEPVPSDVMKALKAISYYDALAKGRPLAAPGGRRHALFSCAGMVAQALETADPILIYRVMLGAVLSDKTVIDAHGNPDPAPDATVLWDACTFVARRQAAKIEENEEMKRVFFANARDQTKTFVESLKGSSASTDDAAQAYTPETDEQLSRRLILTEASAKGFYVLRSDGAYEGPIGSPLLALTVDKCSPRLGSALITSKTGAIRPLADILRMGGTLVKQVIAVLGQPGNRYNPRSGILYEGIAALRDDIQPVFHQSIQDWLVLLGGANHHKLLNWLATITDLTRPTCALYIEGEPGCGKGMLAGGISRLYGGPPVNYAEFVGPFNGGLARSPIIWADEKMPSSRYGETPTEAFRSLVGNSDFTLSRKFMPTTPVQGCLRLIITANNSDALGIGENLSPHDYAAVVQRVGYIRVDPSTAQQIKSLGGRDYTEDWVSGDLIAEHVLWLRDNLSVARGSRLLVEGWEENFHRNLNLNLGSNHLVLETLCFILANGIQDPGTFVGNGSFCTSASAVLASWPAAVGLHKPPPSRKLLHRALLNFSHGKKRVEAPDGTRTRVWDIDLPEGLRLAEEYDLGEAEEIKQRVEAPAGWKFAT